MLIYRYIAINDVSCQTKKKKKKQNLNFWLYSILRQPCIFVVKLTKLFKEKLQYMTKTFRKKKSKIAIYDKNIQKKKVYDTSFLHIENMTNITSNY